MSKLSRKEFKELLIEWKQNFLNERVTKNLQSHVESKFPIDIVFVSRKIFMKDYKVFLTSLNKSESIEEEVKANTFYAGFKDQPMSLSFKKSENFKNFMLQEHDKNQIFHTQENKNKFLKSFNDKDLCILLPTSWDPSVVSTSDASNLNWQIHDLFHSFFHMSHGSSYYGDLNNPFDDMEFEENNDIVPFISKTVGLTGQELVKWLQSINFTAEIDTNDLTPSLFSWCTLKLPREATLAKTIVNKQNLSDKSKTVLHQMHTISYNLMDMMIRDFKNQFIYLSFSTN